MIEEVRLQNFRCFEDLAFPKLSGVNVIVGDNGVGKTALLEAVYLALCTNPQKAVQLRQWRGSDFQFAGTPESIFEAFYGDLFYQSATSIEIELRGEGPEARSLTISRGKSSLLLSAQAKTVEQAVVVSPIEFDWTDNLGEHHAAGTKIGPGGIEFETTGEVLRNFYFFGANMPPSSREASDLFSDLRKRRSERKFVNLFARIFPWIDLITSESSAGGSALFAGVDGTDRLVPLASVSGAVNRMAAVLIAIASSKDGIVLVDEIENGVFYRNHQPLIRALLDTSREYNCQLFLTTHSSEWIDALDQVAGDEMEDITLLRLERGAAQPTLTRVGGRTLRAGLASSGELR